jgi:hypothetical protein
LFPPGDAEFTLHIPHGIQSYFPQTSATSKKRFEEWKEISPKGIFAGMRLIQIALVSLQNGGIDNQDYE